MIVHGQKDTSSMHVLIVDDHPLYIKGVQALLLELDSSIRTTGARSLDDALPIARDSTVDLVLLDLGMPGFSGLEALAQTRKELPAIPIVVLSAEEDAGLIWSAIELGAAGYIPKVTDQTLTIQALHLVLARGVYIPPHALKSQATRQPQEPAPARAPRAQPSPRQLAVLRGILQGKSNKMIARDLDITEGTVKAHLTAVYGLLGVNTRLNAMIRAHELNLVDFFPPL